MKKILFTLLAAVTCLSMSAQQIKVYENGVLLQTYKNNTKKQIKVVVEEGIPVTGVTLDKTTTTVGVGLTTTLVATASPADATDDTFTWSSSAPTVATVSAAGVVTGVAIGTATITAKANGASGVQATCEVTVTAAEVHEYVDLGLPSGKLWAKMNIGATSISDYGNYFAWGETTGYLEGKTRFTINNYKYYNKTTGTDGEGFEVTIKGYTKYVTSGNATRYGYDGFYDDKTTLDAEDDAAAANWGDGWYMPKQADFQELKDNCTWTWATLNGVKGYKVTGSNNNYIFLPAAGSRYDSSLDNAGYYGYYRSSELYSYSAWVLNFSSSGFLSGNYSDDRYYGRPVRAVHSASVASVSLNKTTTSVVVGATETLSATVAPSGAIQNVTWSSSDTNVATVDANGKVRGVAVGTVTITVTSEDGSKTATCEVTVTAPEYVDLGLPSGTLWATCNLGASAPEGYGDYFAWGETNIQSDNAYSWASYKYANGAENKLTKYCNDSSYGNGGFTDSKNMLDAEDDAATANWGDGWCMPTQVQLQELVNSSNTTTQWTNINGVVGRKITSKANGNSIFLPAAGDYSNGSLYNTGSCGYYWSSVIDPDSGYTHCAIKLTIKSNSVTSDYSAQRYLGLSVRPVKKVAVSSVSLNKTAVSIVAGNTQTLSATITPSGATNKNVSWTSSNTDVATVDETGKVTGVAAGAATITVTTEDGNKTATCEVTVIAATAHEYVDLGLPSGTIWATCNVGASAPEEYGDYFAWGETAPQEDNAYSWESYKLCNGSSSTITKYNYPDSKTILDAEDDAATANWGCDWCMPSRIQIAELENSNYTTAEWTTINGVYGQKITSKSNGNFIFLPAAGRRTDGSLGQAGSGGYYWHSQKSYFNHQGATCLNFGSSGCYENTGANRCYGQSVRPVKKAAVSSISLNKSTTLIFVGCTEHLIATIAPGNASNPNITWTSSNTKVATVSSGYVSGVADGTATITATTEDGNKSATCEVTIKTIEYVDLGLPSGTLWAAWNIGATAPEEYGDYFAWGETEPQEDNAYSWASYKWCNGSYNTMTKYCNNYNYGTNDYKTELDAEDDAATANWGSDWRMPTQEQMQELYNDYYTYTEYITTNGVYGLRITSKSNGNSIFLPFAGERFNGSLSNADSDGYYWTNSIDSSSSYIAITLQTYYGNQFLSHDFRCSGLSVRAVRTFSR